MEYQVIYRVNAIIGVKVDAEDNQSAIAKADKIIQNGYFKDNFEYIDGNKDVCGFNNMDLWDL